MAKIIVKESEITILSINENDYISLTDIARHKSDDPFIVINNWMRNRNTIEYLGMWETLFNPYFKPIEFDRFKTRVEERFPHPEIFNRVPVSHPVIDDDKRIITLMSSDISQ